MSSPSDRICLVGETGSGKSTTAAVLQHLLASAGRPSEQIPLAALLNRLQRLVYGELDLENPLDRQDQRLMLDLATNIRRIRPTALVEAFEKRLAEVPSGTVIINADLRDHAVDATRLRDLGFYFVRIRTTRRVRNRRLDLRDDLSVVDDERVFELDRIDCDEEFDNGADGLDNVRAFCARLVAGVLCC